jgi:hypothetical protein
MQGKECNLALNMPENAKLVNDSSTWKDLVKIYNSTAPADLVGGLNETLIGAHEVGNAGEACNDHLDEDVSTF